jgi:hypothetical protein
MPPDGSASVLTVRPRRRQQAALHAQDKVCRGPASGVAGCVSPAADKRGDNSGAPALR